MNKVQENTPLYSIVGVAQELYNAFILEVP